MNTSGGIQSTVMSCGTCWVRVNRAAQEQLVAWKHFYLLTPRNYICGCFLSQVCGLGLVLWVEAQPLRCMFRSSTCMPGAPPQHHMLACRWLLFCISVYFAPNLSCSWCLSDWGNFSRSLSEHHFFVLHLGIHEWWPLTQERRIDIYKWINFYKSFLQV